MTTPATFVDIAVAKAYLDLAVRPTSAHERRSHDGAGIGRIVARFQPLRPALIVLEATGGLEIPLATSSPPVGFRP